MNNIEISDSNIEISDSNILWNPMSSIDDIGFPKELLQNPVRIRPLDEFLFGFERIVRRLPPPLFFLLVILVIFLYDLRIDFLVNFLCVL